MFAPRFSPNLATGVSLGAIPDAMVPEAKEAIVVLGCRLRFATRLEGSRSLVGPGARRAARAAEVFFARAPEHRQRTVIVASGGRAWDEVVEADALALVLLERGVPPPQVLRERWSHSTRENAQYSGELLRARGIDAVEIVTCEYHVPRARALFEREGFRVRATAAAPGKKTVLGRAYELGRERVATWFDLRAPRRKEAS